MEDEDFAPDAGDESMSLDEAASAFVKANATEPEGQPEAEVEDEGEEADDELESDEDEGEDDGEPEDEEGQADEEDEDEPESEGGRFVASDGRVRLPDGTIATVAELVQGNLKERDYRQKTMGLADERRQIEEQSKALEASTKEAEEQRDYMVNLLQSIMPQAPDPNMVGQDPIGYTEQKARYDAFMSHLQYLQHQQQTTKQQSEAKAQTEKQEKSQQEWTALLEASSDPKSGLPNLKDQEKASAFVNSVRSTAKSFGFTDQEIAETLPYDHRMVLALHKAAKWDRLQASKPKAKDKVKGKPPVQKGGKRLAPNARQMKHATDAMNRLKQTGSVDDAARAYLASTGKG